MRVAFRVMKFGRYVTVDDGGNYVTVYKLQVITFSLLCVKHFSGFIETLGWKGILCTLKKVLRQPHNMLTLQVSLRDK